ncbi:MAG: hypothetical protein AAGC54_15840, partial [Cyanobacteria bacterium P01_F01_bin.4]
MRKSWFSKRLGPLHSLPGVLIIALLACTLCLLLPVATYSQTTPAPICLGSGKSDGRIVFENEAFYCLPVSDEQIEKPDSNPIETFAKKRDIPIDALKQIDSDSSSDGQQQQASLYYFESPTSNEKTPLLTIPANTSEEDAANILEKTQRAVQRYRQREFGCALTNQTVSIGKIYKEPFLCVESGILNEPVKARAERIASQIDKVVIAGDINVETLEIIPVPELRTSLGISKYIGLESDADLDNQAMAIVSRSQTLANKDKVILIVTDLDTVLFDQNTPKETDLSGDATTASTVSPPNKLSPYELSNLYLDRITQTSKYAYAELERPVTFNTGPYFWVRPVQIKPNSDACSTTLPQRGQIILFCVQSLGTYYNASFRADEISKNIDIFANRVNPFPYIPLFQPVEDLKAQPENEGGEIKIRYGENDDQEIMTVTQKEVSSNTLEARMDTPEARMKAAKTLLGSIQATVRAYRRVYYRTLIGTILFSAIGLFLIWRIFKQARRRRRFITNYSRLWLIPILAGFSIFGYFLPFVRRFSPVQAFGSTVGAIATYLFSDFPALLSVVIWGAVVFWLLPIVLFEL